MDRAVPVIVEGVSVAAAHVVRRRLSKRRDHQSDQEGGADSDSTGSNRAEAGILDSTHSIVGQRPSHWVILGGIGEPGVDRHPLETIGI